MTNHPLNETAAAEVTDEMRRAAASAYEDMAQVTRPENHEKCLNAALSAALAVATPADDRPWEPLREDDSLNAGDEVRRDSIGVTATAVVARVAESGDPVTAEGGFIGSRRLGTWYVRRTVQELPEEDGAVIVPADGHEYIETRTGKKSRRLTWDAECLVWYDARGTHLHGDITPGTWKVEGE